jgi:hypothetical protein
MSDNATKMPRALIGQGVTPDFRPFVEWRNRPRRFTPTQEVQTHEMDGTAEYLIVDTEANQIDAYVVLPPLSTVEDGVRFTVQNLWTGGQNARRVYVTCRDSDQINELEDARISFGPGECRQFCAFRYEWDAEAEGPVYRSWYCCQPAAED